jgi:CelD/BcsL family acetyltransferase involved in cellulose biosynthesis
MSVGPHGVGLGSVPGCYWPFRSVPLAADIAEDEIAAILSDANARRFLGRAWRLGPVMGDDPAANLLQGGAARAGWTILARPAGTAYVLDIAAERASGPWPRPSTVRNNHKHEKRLARLGALSFTYVEGAGWTKAVFDDLAAIERNSWVATRAGADPKFIDPRLRALWEAAVSDPDLAARFSAGILSVGGVPACFSFGINCGDRRYSIASSYDDRFGKHSPGSVTGYRTYELSADRGASLLNLGSGDSGQKSSMGAVAGPALTDFLFVRSRALAVLLRPFWERKPK